MSQYVKIERSYGPMPDRDLTVNYDINAVLLSCREESNKLNHHVN